MQTTLRHGAQRPARTVPHGALRPADRAISFWRIIQYGMKVAFLLAFILPYIPTAYA